MKTPEEMLRLNRSEKWAKVLEALKTSGLDQIIRSKTNQCLRAKYRHLHWKDGRTRKSLSDECYNIERNYSKNGYKQGQHYHIWWHGAIKEVEWFDDNMVAIMRALTISPWNASILWSSLSR